MEEFLIAGGSEQFYTEIAAKNLKGAKIKAVHMYQYAVGGKVTIAENYDDGQYACIRILSVKHGFDSWQDYF